jgi:ABC-type sugar transport system substrate-binding protein
MTATIAQFYYNMGAYGIEKSLEMAKGRSLPLVFDTGTLLVTKKNAADFK